MKRLFACMAVLACFYYYGKAQTYYQVVTDTVKVVNAELSIGNKTKDTLGYLFNSGNGITRFQKLHLSNLGDTAIAIAGQDTVSFNGKPSGRYFVLNRSIPIIPNHYYHPLVFEIPLDSGKLYNVQVLINLHTLKSDNYSSVIRLQYSDTSLNGISTVNTRVYPSGDIKKYAYQYDKLIQSAKADDTLKLSFATGIIDTSGTMQIDPLSYTLLQEIVPAQEGYDYTVDTAYVPPVNDTLPEAPPLQPDEYYVTDSANFNFTPVSQHISGWTDVAGDPSSTVINEAAANGWAVNTVSTSAWHPSVSGTSSEAEGEVDPSVNDYFGFWQNDSALVHTNFVNHLVQFNATTPNWNLQITGLDSTKLYRIEMMGSRIGTGTLTGTGPGRSYYVVHDNNAYGAKNVGHFMNYIANTSKSVVWDTLTPDASGHINIGIYAADSVALQSPQDGYIAGLKIWEISKNEQGTGKKVALFHYADSLDTYVNDGTKTREVLVYYPIARAYNPGTKYPLIFYMGGQGECGLDAELMRKYGIPGLIEHGRDLFGINATGDTVRFVVATALWDVTEYGLNPSQIRTILTYLKNNPSLPIDTANVFITGFSSGGESTYGVANIYPYLAKAYATYSAAGTSAWTNGSALKDNNAFYWEYIFSDPHFSSNVSDFDSMSLHNPGYIRASVWYGRPHNGFTACYDTSFVNPEFGQTVYDFFANHTVGRDTAFARFRFTNFNGGGAWEDYGFTDVLGSPVDSVVTVTDPLSHFTISSVAASKWFYADQEGSGIQDGAGYFFGPYSVIGFWSTKTPQSYANNGNNLEISNLKPNTPYELYFMSSNAHYDFQGAHTVVQYGVNGMFKELNIDSNKGNKYVKIEGTSDGSGVIHCSVYGSVLDGTSSGYGSISALIIREKNP